MLHWWDTGWRRCWEPAGGLRAEARFGLASADLYFIYKKAPERWRGFTKRINLKKTTGKLGAELGADSGSTLPWRHCQPPLPPPDPETTLTTVGKGAATNAATNVTFFGKRLGPKQRRQQLTEGAPLCKCI